MIIKIHEGISIKSKDIKCCIKSIFFLAKNIISINLTFNFLYIIFQVKDNLIDNFLLTIKLKSLQVSHRQAHDELVKLRFADLNLLSTS